MVMVLPKIINKPFNCSAKTAEQGYAAAQYNLGLRYAKGEGVAQDYKTAIKWYHLAAEQGVAKAQIGLGVMYAKGRGVPKNTRMAYMFLLLALANSEDESERELIEEVATFVESELTLAQKQRARSDAAEYQAKIDARQ